MFPPLDLFLFVLLCVKGPALHQGFCMVLCEDLITTMMHCGMFYNFQTLDLILIVVAPECFPVTERN